MPLSPLKTPFFAAYRRPSPPEKASSGPSPKRQGDSRIASATLERTTYTKGQRWTPLACDSSWQPAGRTISLRFLYRSSSLLLRFRYFFQGTEFAPFCCILVHPSPFLLTVYSQPASNQGIMNHSHL